MACAAYVTAASVVVESQQKLVNDLLGKQERLHTAMEVVITSDVLDPQIYSHDLPSRSQPTDPTTAASAQPDSC